MHHHLGSPDVYLASVATREPELPDGAAAAKNADLAVVGPKLGVAAGAHDGSRWKRGEVSGHLPSFHAASLRALLCYVLSYSPFCRTLTAATK